MRVQATQLVAWEGLDCVSTLRGVALGSSEANPFGAWLLQSPVVFVAVKLLAVALALLLAWFLFRINPRLAVGTLRAASVAMLAVVSWNVWLGLLVQP